MIFRAMCILVINVITTLFTTLDITQGTLDAIDGAIVWLIAIFQQASFFVPMNHVITVFNAVLWFEVVIMVWNILIFCIKLVKG